MMFVFVTLCLSALVLLLFGLYFLLGGFFGKIEPTEHGNQIAIYMGILFIAASAMPTTLAAIAKAFI